MRRYLLQIRDFQPKTTLKDGFWVIFLTKNFFRFFIGTTGHTCARGGIRAQGGGDRPQRYDMIKEKMVPKIAMSPK